MAEKKKSTKKTPRLECVFCKRPLTRKEAYVIVKDGKTVYAHGHHPGVIEVAELKGE
jgi:hypothetical protein